MSTFDRWILRIIVLALIAWGDFAAIYAIFFQYESITFGSWVALGMVFFGSIGFLAFTESENDGGSDRLDKFWRKTSLICLYGFLSLSAILAILGFV